VFARSWRLARVAGVEIRIDPSWAFIALLIGWNFFLIVDSRFDLGAGEVLGLAIGAAALFFVSVLLHELAHALVLQSRGIEVDGITLFLFGGATRMKGEPSRPDDEIVASAAGPLTSLAIAAVLGAIALSAGDTGNDAVLGVLGSLAWLNLFLAVFNMLPGLPLDGGRVLRGIVWKATGDVDRATRVAATGGRAVGFATIGLGILVLFAGGVLGALWLGAIGWFLAQAAQVEYESFRLRRAFEGVRAGDVMSRQLVRIPGDLTVDQAIRDYFLRYDHAAYPVTTPAGRDGLVTLRRVRRVPVEERARRRMEDLAIPAEELAAVRVDTPMRAVLESLDDEEVNRVVVRDNGHIVGIIAPTDITRWTRRRTELGLEP
jgi:Zn-dependent protease/predicted transcriptional regulator